MHLLFKGTHMEVVSDYPPEAAEQVSHGVQALSGLYRVGYDQGQRDMLFGWLAGGQPALCKNCLRKLSLDPDAECVLSTSGPMCARCWGLA